MIEPLDFITRLREIYPEEYAKDGNCLKFHLLLKAMYPQAIGFYDSDHVITEIDGRYYDIDGLAEKVKGFLPMSEYGEEVFIDFPTQRHIEVFA